MSPQTFVLLAGFLFGIVFGSFLNVAIHRLPREESLAFPGSHCPKCNGPIRWYDNIPLLSWAILGGRCRHCDVPISIRYPLVELLSGIFLAAYLLRFGLWAGLTWYAFTAALIVVTAVDIDFKIIPNSISLPGIPIGLALNAAVLSRDPMDGLVNGLLGMAFGGGILLLVAGGYYLITKREGMGMGDPKLLGMIGAFVGWQGVVFTMLVGSLVGTLIGGTWIILARKGRRFEIPFGPFLSFGAVAWVWVGPMAVRWYLGG